MRRGLRIMGDCDVKQGLKYVLEKISAACEKRNPVNMVLLFNICNVIENYVCRNCSS